MSLFHNVVLHPEAPSSSENVMATKHIATAKIRKSLESNSLLDKKVKKSREKFAFSEFCRNSSKKNELFFDFLVPKFGR